MSPLRAVALLPVLALTLLSAPAAHGEGKSWQPVTLTPYPQKVRTFYRLDDARLPASLKSNAVSLPVGGITATAQARDGAIWLGTTQGLMRLEEAAPARDRRQYFAGRRYLPDDAVQQIVPDAQAGVWVRTRTGVAHLELVPPHARAEGGTV
jgi:hypothetical protein